jgi:hypothetical protein
MMLLDIIIALGIMLLAFIGAIFLLGIIQIIKEFIQTIKGFIKKKKMEKRGIKP